MTNQLASRESPVSSTLARIEAAQLIRRADDSGEVGDFAYIFKHALVQDTAYASLLKQDRKQLHHIVADTLEDAYPERLDQLAPLLAEHYLEAEDDAKTLLYATRAGDAAARVYAHAEAIANYTRALAVARRVWERAEDSPLQYLYAQRGRELELASCYADAMQSYLEMEQAAQAHRDSAMEIAALVARTTLYSTFTPLYDPARGLELAERALEMARRHNDRRSEAKILWNLVLLSAFGEARLDLAIEYGEQSLAIARELNLTEQIAFTLNDLFYPFFMQRTLPENLALVRETQTYWRELHNQPMLIDSLVNEGLVHMMQGEFQTALNTEGQAFELAASISNYWGQSYASMHPGFSYWELGDPQHALEAMNNAIQFGARGGFETPKVFNASEMGWMYVELGAWEQGLTLIDQALDFAERALPFFGQYANVLRVRALVRAGELEQARLAMEEGRFHFGNQTAIFSHPIVTSNLALGRAEYALGRGEIETAIAHLQRLIAYLRGREIRLGVPAALTLLARAQLAQQHWADAEGHLNEARAEAQALGAQWRLWQIDASCAELAAQRGDTAQAAKYRSGARQTIESIIARIPEQPPQFADLNLRATFRKRHDVRVLMEPE